ncbi:precorrin-6y C5,15-methyltransferase (decarboxylating) subunit CbiE [Nakamurella leprariae]|uniref:precorrin-6y C5,15-methyltransferase (decarboxylating) subunit CbiE n=1 Tax=Nakamurella leprariae TaxID=2803911 RepID=UPI002E28AC24|nr:precorrin-6y C5,15-methyltransferase (decarboxylating) subunit CbiE [Nakamurella leprariae]
MDSATAGSTAPVGPAAPGRVAVVGIGLDGWSGLGAAARAALLGAQVVIGSPRQLVLLANTPVTAARRELPRPLRDGLPAMLADVADRRVVVLASGDPLVSGIGTTLIDLFGAGRVRVLPAVSSVALARARLGWSAESTEVVTVVGRDHAAVLAAVAPGRRVLVLSSDGRSPAVIAGLLHETGWGASEFTVLEHLGGPDETLIAGSAGTWPAERLVRPLHVLAVHCRVDPGGPAAPAPVGIGPLPRVGGLPDEAFEHDGQLTKRDLRASALARLAPQPGELLWDVGAGAGSVAIEWCRTDPTCAAVAIERNTTRAERITRNATRLGVPAVRVLTGVADDVLADLTAGPATGQAPDAVFVGGGATTPGLLEMCWRALRPGGRMVVHGVTLETEERLLGWYRERGGELVRLSVERVQPLGGFAGWTPSRAVVQWTGVRSVDVR